MTLKSTPLAVDGGQIDGAQLRTQAYVTANGNAGIVGIGDMKVSQLDVAGVGLKIAAGSAVVLNYYQSSPTEAYVASDPNGTTLDSSYMPAAAGAQQYHLVCATVGDPEFSQVGHPWMTSDPIADPVNFEYARYYIIRNVPSAALANPMAAQKWVRDNKDYPATVLAGLTIPANTTTITSSMIKDLRNVAAPLNTERIEHIAGASNNLLNANSGNWENWPNTAYFDLEIPEWAVKAKVTGFVEGARLTKNGIAMLRVAFQNGGVTTATQINENGSTGRRSYNVGGEISIPESYRGTTQRIRIEGTCSNTASAGMLDTDAQTSAQIRVRLEQEAT